MLGQFKHLIKALPEGKAPEIVAFALHRWFDVTYRAKEKHGAFKCPDVPQVGFLLKFANVAVDLWTVSGVSTCETDLVT